MVFVLLNEEVILVDFMDIEILKSYVIIFWEIKFYSNRNNILNVCLV